MSYMFRYKSIKHNDAYMYGTHLFRQASQTQKHVMQLQILEEKWKI